MPTPVHIESFFPSPAWLASILGLSGQAGILQARLRLKGRQGHKNEAKTHEDGF